MVAGHAQASLERGSRGAGGGPGGWHAWDGWDRRRTSLRSRVTRQQEGEEVWAEGGSTGRECAVRDRWQST